MNLRVITEFDLLTDSYAVYCPELPGCASAGETEKQALDNIKEAIELYFEPEEVQLDNKKHLHELTI